MRGHKVDHGGEVLDGTKVSGIAFGRLHDAIEGRGSGRFDFSPHGAGAPLAETMRRGWQGQIPPPTVSHPPVPKTPAFQGILGDPTLRHFRVTPPQNVRASRVGSVVTLAWDAAAEPGIAYYVYRSNSNGVDGFAMSPNPLNTTPLQGATYTDDASGANLTYQIRATKLQSSGADSFWNISQGTFINVP